jgi:hypothetical protein
MGSAMTDDRPVPLMTSATIVAAEGARVALMTCLGCGAAVLVDPRPDAELDERATGGAVALHQRWHAEQEAVRGG